MTDDKNVASDANKGNEKDNLAIALTADTTVTLHDLTTALSELPMDKLISILKEIIRKGKGDQLREVVDALEIMTTESSFRDANKKDVLEATVTKYNFEWWLNTTERKKSREAVIDFWDFVMTMAFNAGLKTGTINSISQTTNLWKATGNLAKKMLENPSKYRFLPAILINNPELVSKTLMEITDPKAFQEVLVGESWEDMTASDIFLGGFSLTEDKNAEGCVATLMLCLQM